MKIRNGFVSNSSSSSFLIISKNGELTKDMLMSAFAISEKSPLYPMAKQMANEMVNDCEEYTVEEYMDNFGWETLEDVKEESEKDYNIIQNAKEHNWKIYMGSADSYEQPALCEMDLNYEDDNIKIEKEGGY